MFKIIEAMKKFSNRGFQEENVCHYGSSSNSKAVVKENQ
jgi:hypothetical protein